MATFGYTTAGASGGGFFNDDIIGDVYTAPDSGTVQSFHASVKDTGGDGLLKGVLVETSGLTIVTDGVTAQSTVTNTTQDWLTLTFGTDPSITGSTEYALTIISDTSDVIQYFDNATETNGVIYDSSNNFTTPTDPTDKTFLQNRQDSIYATYTPLYVSGTATFPTLAVNDATLGTIDWVDVIGSDTLIDCVSADGGGMVHPTGVRVSGGVTDTSAKLFIAGTASGTSQHLGTTFSTSVRTYGSSSNLWGLTPTVSEVNASDFGFGISFTGNGGVSKYLYVSGFGFNVPVGATINGITVDCDVENPGGTPRIDYIQMSVTYTEAGGGTAEGSPLLVFL